ncbi:MAG: hypothetical protein JWR16_2310 [Nevskia sp.]|nr:hypothetical protein [Nevskia sp.]
MIDFGIPAQDFREHLLEQRAHLYKSALQARPFKWSDLNTLLYQIEPVEPLFQLFSNGLVPADNFSEEVVELGTRRRRLHKDRFYKYMSSGATLVINRLELFAPAARHLADEISRYTGHTATGNGYITFAGNGTFGKHWDVHDVFAVQLIGRKRWQIFPPTFAYPLSHHSPGMIGGECPPTPALECVMEPGDILYIPRGWWHNVVPLDEASFHLSVGVYIPTVLDYVLWSCSRYLQLQPSARKGLVGGAATQDDIAKAMQAAAAAALNPAHLADYMKSIAERQRPAVEVDLNLFADADGLNGDETVTLNARCEVDAIQAVVALNGARVQLDPIGSFVLKLLADTAPLTLTSLCKLAGPASSNAIRASVVGLAKRDIVLIGGHS